LIFTSFHQSPLPLALLLRMAGVKRVAANSVDYPGSLLDVRHDCPDDVHEVVRSLSLAAACGHAPPTGDDRRLRVCSSAPLHPDAAALRPYVVVHPGASVGARAWSAERHRELVRLLLSEGHNVLLTGAPDERPLTTHVGRGFAAKRLAGQGALLDLAGETYLDELAEVFAAADAIVVANTGPAHLAAAVGTPIVSLFAPTVPTGGWRPWGVPHELLNCEVPCAGCRARTCPVAGHPCLEGVSAQAVLEALRGLLARTEDARVRPLPARQAPPRELAVRRSSESREIAA
jgi:ADP-heptose:LPS heptosyltransferase